MKRLSLLLMLLFPFLVGAQSIPNPISPSVLERQFQRPILPKASPGPVISVPESEPALPAGVVDFSFILHGVEVVGNSVYSATELSPLYATYLHQEVTLATIYQLARSITAKYRNDGYLLCQTIVPAQQIKDGMIRLQVVEGYISRVVVEGDYRDFRELLRRTVGDVTENKPLQAAALERALLLANDLPGLSVKGLLRPAEHDVGAAELVVVVTAQPVTLSFGGDNRGSRYIGPHQLSTQLEGRSLLGLLEESSIYYVNATPDFKFSETALHYAQVTHGETLNRMGTKLDLYYRYTKSTPIDSLQPFELVGVGTTAGFRLSHPFQRSRRSNVSIHSGLEVHNADSQVQGQDISEDRLRVFSLGTLYDFIDRFGGISMVGLELRQGLDICNASQPDSSQSRANGRSDFTSIRLEGYRLQNLSQGYSVLFAFSGQFSFDPLLVSEEFGVGGNQYGRAYDPFEIHSDQGMAAKLEVQYGSPFPESWLRDYQLYLFTDYGAIWDEHGDNWDSLTSAGFGARLNITVWLSGSVEWAKPLTRAVTAEEPDGRGGRYFFMVQARY